MRKFIVSFLLIFVLFNCVVPVYKEPAYAEPVYAEEEEEGDQGGLFEIIVATLVEFPIRIVQKIGTKTAALQPLDKLVFLAGASEEEKQIAPWIPSEISFIKLWYLAMLGLCMPLYIIAVAVSGFKITMSGAKPGMREEAISSVWRWFGAIAVVLLAPLLVQTLLWITMIILDGIQYAFGLVTSAAGIGRNISDWGGINFGGVSVSTGSVLGTAIVKVLFVFIWFWFNAIYFVRKLVLTMMICFTPFMALMWALNKNVNAVGIWLGELASNAFMPVAHALVLCVIIGFMDVKNIGNGTWFQILIAVYTIMPLAEVLRNSMQGLITRMSGINEEQTAGKAIAAAAGLGGLLSLGRITKATMGGGSSNLAGDDFNDAPGGGGKTLAPVPIDNNRQIGFLSPDIQRQGAGNPYADGLGNESMSPESVDIDRTFDPKNPVSVSRDKPTQPHPLQKVITSAGGAGKAARYTDGAVINMASGAVPGMREISSHINQGMEMTARGLSVPLALGYQTMKRSKETGRDPGESLKEITGADTTLKAVGRGILLTAKTAYSPESGMKQARAYMATSPCGLDGGRER